MHEVQERLQALLGGEYELLARLDQSGLGLEAATAEMRNRTSYLAVSHTLWATEHQTRGRSS